MNLANTTLFFIATLATPAQHGVNQDLSYVPILGLARDNATPRPTRLIGSPLVHLTYSWNDEVQKIDFKAYYRADPADSWLGPLEATESVAFYMTAVAPQYAPSALYVFGVQGTKLSPMTVVERWEVVVDTIGLEIQVARNHVLSSTSLTHIEAAAVDPDETFFIAKHHETDALWRVSIADGAVNTILTVGSFPTLYEMSQVAWQQHPTLGHAFKLMPGRSGFPDDTEDSSVMVIWDADLDGFPESVEVLAGSAWADAGYADVEWFPYSVFDSSFP